MQAAPSPPQTRPLRGEKFRFPSSPIPCFHALPLQALLSPLFLFLPFFCPPTLSCVVGLIFSHPILPPPLDSSTTGSHAFNRACLGLRWCRSPTRLSKPHTGSHRCEFGFFLQNEFTLPLKGGGAGYRLFSSSEFSRGEARCFSAGKEGRFVSEGFSGSCLWQLLATTGSHGFNRAGVGLRWCRSLTRPPKTHTGPHRGEFGFCLLAGASQEDHPPFRQSRIRTQAEEKNTSALLFKNRTS